MTDTIGNNKRIARNEEPAQSYEIWECPEIRKPDEEGGQLSRPFLESGFPIQEGRGLHDRQQLGGTVHPTFDERAEELAVLRQQQDGACQRNLPLYRVHL